MSEINDRTTTLQPLSQRTKQFAVRIIRVVSSLPQNSITRVLGDQLLRSGTSVGAHCREAFRGRSDAEMISKLEVAAQELDEAVYWLELVVESESVKLELLQPLMKEADEILAVIISSVKTIKGRRKR